MLPLLIISAISSFTLSSLVLFLTYMDTVVRHLLTTWIVLSGAAAACWFSTFCVYKYSALKSPSLIVIFASIGFHCASSLYLLFSTWWKVVGTQRAREERKAKFLMHEKVIEEYRELAKSEWEKCYHSEENTDTVIGVSSTDETYGSYGSYGTDISSMSIESDCYVSSYFSDAPTAASDRTGPVSTASSSSSSSSSWLSIVFPLPCSIKLEIAEHKTIFPSFCRPPQIDIFKRHSAEQSLCSWDSFLLRDEVERMV